MINLLLQYYGGFNHWNIRVDRDPDFEQRPCKNFKKQRRLPTNTRENKEILELKLNNYFLSPQ